MAKKARNNEIEAAPRKPATRKRKSHDIDQVAAPRKPAMSRKRKRKGGASRPSTAASGMCDDVFRSIFARVPARTAVASTALSTHHRRMILCPEFRNLHCRLGPPLPQPHIAYIATAKIKDSCGKYLVSGFHGFHVAGVGHSGNTPMRSLTGPTYLNMRYVNTCNGIVLFADLSRHSTCVLWIPAVADGEKQVTVPVSASEKCVILGLGYGRRSQTYKLLVLRSGRYTTTSGWNARDLLAYTLQAGAGGEQQRLRTVLGEETFSRTDGEIFNKSLYIDGTIYLLHNIKGLVLAFNVDDETVTSINLPKGYVIEPSLEMSRLVEMCGRPCIETGDYICSCRTLWLLTVDNKWEPRCVIRRDSNSYHLQSEFDRSSIAGVWDCGGVILLYVQRGRGRSDHHNKLYLFDPSTNKMYKRNLPWNLMPELSTYAFCWGYKPTLVSPRSIVGEDQGRCSDHEKDKMDIIEPLNEREKRKGRKATMTTVCFMKFLVGIMQKLPENMQDVIEMKMLNSDPYILFKDAIEFCSQKK